MLSSVDEEDIGRKPEDGSLSAAETLDHIGDGLWWFCSRLSDDLPEPGSECPANGLPRIQCLIPWAEAWLLSVEAGKRNEVLVPTRYPSQDPSEAWTFAKVCRRQAEHVVEHLDALARRATIGLTGLD
jgi:hypothetical protein